MYLRTVHADASIAELRQLIHENPLGILTTAIPSPNHPLIQTTHIPFILDVEDPTSETELGILRGHLARANPHSKAMIESLESSSSSSTDLEQEVMVLFNLPVQHYITPKFYTQTKPETGKVVPTWNYAATQIYGRARLYHDSGTEATKRFLAQQIDDLSQHAEKKVMGFDGRAGREGPWRVADAPEKYIKVLAKAIVGIEISVSRLEGKFKMSQELGVGDREGVVQGLRGVGSVAAEAVAGIVGERGERKIARKKTAA